VEIIKWFGYVISNYQHNFPQPIPNTHGRLLQKWSNFANTLDD